MTFSNQSRASAISIAITSIRRDLLADKPASVGNSRNHLGIALAALGRYRWAIKCYERAECELTAAGDREGVAFARNNRGTVLYELGDYEGALVLQIEAMAMLRDIGAPRLRIATGLRNIGAALHKLGKFEAAVARYDEALGLLASTDVLHRLLIGGLRFNRGAARERLGDLIGAAADYEAAMSTAVEAPSDQIEARTADAAYHLATVLHVLGNPTRAAALARSAVVGAVRARRSDLVWRCLAAFARIAHSGAARIAIGKIAATLLWNEARQIAGEKLASRDRYLGVRGTGFSELAGALVDEGRLTEALTIGGTADRLGVAEFLPTRWLIPEAVALTEGERDALARWHNFAGALRKAPDSPERAGELAAWLDAPISAAKRAVPIAPSSVVRAASGRWRVQFAVRNGRLLRVATIPGEAAIVSEGPAVAGLYRRIFDFARLCRQSGDTETTKGLSAGLFEDLLGGFELNRDDVLEISVDGPLRALPWAALWDGTRYLIERCPIAVLCGGAASYRDPTDRRWALFAASGAEADSVALPHARREVSAIAGLLGQSCASILIDGAFTSEALREALSGNATALHFAGHFALDPADLGRSRLRLGDGSVLDVRTLAGFDFSRIEEVVLSSCEAGLGDRADDIGDAKSLPDLLAGIGVRHVVAALWPVPDASTADIMIDYHRGRLAGLAPARALAQAQRKALAGGIGGHLDTRERGIGDPVPNFVTGIDQKAWAGFCAFTAVADGSPYAE